MREITISNFKMVYSLKFCPFPFKRWVSDKFCFYIASVKQPNLLNIHKQSASSIIICYNAIIKVK